MTYLLDTNVCIAWIKGDTAVRDRLLKHQPEDLALCSVVTAELRYGAQKSARRAKTEQTVSRFIQPFRSLPFDEECVQPYALLRAQLEAIGTPIGPHDLMIAAIASAHRLTVVTRNLREFERVPGLRVEAW